MGINFIHSAPGEGKKGARAAQRIAKSYATRERHARIRRQRMLEYQLAKQSEGNHDATESPIGGSHVDTSSVTNGSLLDISSSPTILLSASRNHLFSSLNVTPTDLECFLLDYYVNYLAGVEHFPCLQFQDPQAFRTGMTTEWIPMALSNGGMLSGLLIIPCRRMLERTGDDKYSRMAIKYKLLCIKSVNDDISREEMPMGDLTIAKALLLAADEIYYGDRQTYQNHVDAVGRMIQLRGGFHTLGMNGFLGMMVDVFSRTLYARMNRVG